MFASNLGIFDRIARVGAGLALIGFAINSIDPGTGLNGSAGLAWRRSSAA
jgi:hypothetical protein